MQTEKRAGRVMRNVAAVLVIILAIVALFQGFRMRGKEALFRNVAVETENLPEEKQSGDDRAKIACEQGKEVTYQGEKYVYNEDLVSILFLGVDKEAFEEGGTVGDGKAGQADALFLLVLDTKTGKSRLIAISRDTMTDVNVYSDLGNFIGTEKLQLCLAYMYGDGKEKSCENTVRAVSRLFYGMPVAAYAALDLDAGCSRRCGGDGHQRSDDPGSVPERRREKGADRRAGTVVCAKSSGGRKGSDSGCQQ
jgi:anionic cell wall polymer biosynthesis LytR-Cps2A-Psr (LCP) family protein